MQTRRSDVVPIKLYLQKDIAHSDSLSVPILSDVFSTLEGSIVCLDNKSGEIHEMQAPIWGLKITSSSSGLSVMPLVVAQPL